MIRSVRGALAARSFGIIFLATQRSSACSTYTGVFDGIWGAVQSVQAEHAQCAAKQTSLRASKQFLRSSNSNYCSS